MCLHQISQNCLYVIVYFLRFFFFFCYSSSVAISTATVATAAAAVSPSSSSDAVRRRSSDERLPGEPGTSTDGGRPRPADAAATAHGRRAQHCRNGGRPRDQQRQVAREAATTTPPAAMITVGACGSRPKTRGRHHRPQLPTTAASPSSSSATFPVDVTDRLRSPVASAARPRQYGRRRSVQDAAVETAVQAQRQRSRVAVISVSDEPDANAASDADDGRQQEQEPPRLVTPLRSVLANNNTRAPVSHIIIILWFYANGINSYTSRLMCVRMCCTACYLH